MEKYNLLERVYVAALMQKAMQVAFKDENTITKLEEKETDNMKEEIKSMKTLEACAYLRDHNGEYLIAKDNENFELHLGDKGFETKYFVENGADILRNKVTLDYSTLNTKWVIPVKKRLYRISEYIVIDDSEYLIRSEMLYLTDKDCSELRNQRSDALVEEFSHLKHLKYSRVFIKSELMFDNNLNAITKRS